MTATAATYGSAASAVSFGTSRSVWAARIGITPSGMCRLRYRTTALPRIGARTANGAARSAQVTAAETPTTAAT